VLKARGVPDALARLPVFCVGAATANAARRAGFVLTEKGPGTAAGLAAALAQRFGGRGARLLHPAGEDRAFDMAGALAPAGIDVETVAIYRVELRDPGSARLAAALKRCAGGAAFLYSPRTAAHLFALVETYRLWNGIAGLTFMAISENVAAAIPGRRNLSVLVAENPDEDGLMDLLSRRGRASSGLTTSGA
jgi:uroporphyrinogen-III synthase